MNVFCNLPSIARDSNRISSIDSSTKWRSMEYTTRLGKGQLLFASSGTSPEPITLELKQKGWHRIFIGFFNLESYTHLVNYSYLKLSSDGEYTPLRFFQRGMPECWKITEYFQEIFWKCADLTDNDVILAKPNTVVPSISGIAWIRLEEMTYEEIKRYKASLEKQNKCVQMHIDVDSFFEDTSKEKTDNFAKLSMLKNTACDFCSLEYSMLFEEHGKGNASSCFLDFTQNDFDSGKYTYEEIFQKFLAAANHCKIPLYAAERMSVATFHFPLNRSTSRNAFAIENTQYHCENRDGSDVPICSYAYEEVQDFVIERMVKMVRLGFKGISMILHRGVLLGFEEPVRERFNKKNPDLDIRCVPISDKRLHTVWCEIMTEFVRRVRSTLDGIAGERVMLNVITDYGLCTAKHIGIDVETWAREGLIDSISQGDMEIYENLTDCMSDSEPSLIDIEKYSRCLGVRQVLCRNYGTDVDKICEHIGEFTALEEKYGVKVYHALPWVHTIAPEEYMRSVEKMKSFGAKRFFAWNTNHMMENHPEYLLASSLGNDIGTDAPLRGFYRVLSLDGVDISQAVPNWRG